MGSKEILNLINEVNNSRCTIRKWNIINDQSTASYDIRNELIYNTAVLKSNLCDCNDIYNLVRGNITVLKAPVTQITLKSCAIFLKCIAKIERPLIRDAEDLTW